MSSFQNPRAILLHRLYNIQRSVLVEACWMVSCGAHLMSCGIVALVLWGSSRGIFLVVFVFLVLNLLLPSSIACGLTFVSSSTILISYFVTILIFISSIV